MAPGELDWQSRGLRETIVGAGWDLAEVRVATAAGGAGRRCGWL